jgi:hypothetical protein
MTDLVGEWQRTAAHAWRSYEMRGRGSLLLNNRPLPLNSHHLPPRGLNSFRLGRESAPPWLPSQMADYCARYDPRTELVIAIYGFPDVGAPETSACLWIRPPERWTTPPAAWRQLDHAAQDLIDTALSV